MRGKWLLAGGIAIFLAIGAGAVQWWRQDQEKLRKPATPAATTGPTTSGNEISLTGRIEAQEVAAVASPIEGVIDELFVEPGGEVYEGQLLARIRNGKLESELEAATAEVEKIKTRVTNIEGAIISSRLEASRSTADAIRAKGEFDRAERTFSRQQLLLREGATPRLTFEKAEKEYTQLKTENETIGNAARSAEERVSTLARDLDAARKLLETRNEALENSKEEAGRGEIKSPVDGVVVARKGAQGEAVSPLQEHFFDIAVNLTALRVTVEPDAAVLPQIKPGMPAAVRVAESPEELPARVVEVKGSIVVIDFASPNVGVRPGLTAQVRISLPRAGAVPAAAVPTQSQTRSPGPAARE